MRNWLLPENIEDVLPPEGRRIETLRSSLLNLYRQHGYELVMPPMLEYLESLLTGTGEDLDLGTFKLVDQMSGRMVGVRADITPQVARIDAHLLNREGITRLCYSGSVLHTRPRGINTTREPLQIGAEIYGHAGIESDLEVQDLLYKSLDACGLTKARLDLGHVAIFRTLCLHLAIDSELETGIYESLQSKDVARLNQLVEKFDPETRNALLMLPRLYGDRTVLAIARKTLPDYPEIQAALSDLEALSADETRPVNIDLADLRGYHYHSGAVFAAYIPEEANPVAIGGRYDEVGKAFGRARPATGFSMDLRDLARRVANKEEQRGILAPYLPENKELLRTVEDLRRNNEIVVLDLPGHDSTRSELGCDRELVLVGTTWQIRKFK